MHRENLVDHVMQRKKKILEKKEETLIFIL